jgi:hypothetical protein
MEQKLASVEENNVGSAQMQGNNAHPNANDQPAVAEKKRRKHMILEGVSIELVENPALPEGHQTLILTRQVKNYLFWFNLYCLYKISCSKVFFYCLNFC